MNIIKKWFGALFFWRHGARGMENTEFENLVDNAQNALVHLGKDILLDQEIAYLKANYQTGISAYEFIGLIGNMRLKKFMARVMRQADDLGDSEILELEECAKEHFNAGHNPEDAVKHWKFLLSKRRAQLQRQREEEEEQERLKWLHSTDPGLHD